MYQDDDYIISYVTPRQVADIAEALPRITEEQLRYRYYHIDPENYWGSPGATHSDDDFDYTMGYFEDVRAF